MNKNNINKNLLLTIAIAAITLVSCEEVKRTPGTVYMPDMAYSRAIESYTDLTYLKDQGIHFDAKPVAGTIARGKEMPFPYAIDKPGDTTNYNDSKLVPNPIDSLVGRDIAEAERLYLVNCGICHGAKLDGNGPLYKDGNGPYAAKPATLVGDAKYENMPAGQMFYSVAYGKNLMGSYASQLSKRQRWMIIKYIKNKQKK
jgi:mono/diheme cytochrome c family protein